MRRTKSRKHRMEADRGKRPVAAVAAAASAKAIFGHVQPRFTSEANANSAAWANALAVFVIVVGAGSSSAIFEEKLDLGEDYGVLGVGGVEGVSTPKSPEI